MAAQPDAIHFSVDAATSALAVGVPRASRPRPSEYFCSNPRCVFHVRADDAGVNGHGDWAILDGGLTVSHRWIRGELLCDLCARRVRQTR